MLKSLYTPYDWLTNIIGLEINEEYSKVVWGANFSINKEIILSKPKIFYENILRFLNHKNPEVGHYIERGWYILFHNNYIQKKIINVLCISHNIDKYLDNNLNEIHIWYDIYANTCIKNNVTFIYSNKYINIYPNVIDNIFKLNINFSNILILIEFENDNSYEIIINDSIYIRNYLNFNLIASGKIDNYVSYKYIDILFEFNDNIIINYNNKKIIDIKNIFELSYIKNISLKSNNPIHINYDIHSKIKYFVSNKNFINTYYSYNYLDYYINYL